MIEADLPTATSLTEVVRDTVRKEDVEIMRNPFRTSAADAYAVGAVAESDDDQHGEREIAVLLSTFDARLTASEKRIDRVLARLGID